MRLAVTGGNGSIGTAVIDAALARGDRVVNLDRKASAETREGLTQIVVDLQDYDAVLAALAGCDALIHLAAIPWAFRDPDHVVHNNNVSGSYNAMHAAISCGITRICQASSVNAIGLSYSREAHFDYFPFDEKHPNHTEEAYGLSKWICEQQADTFVRRHPELSIASIRFHWVVPDKATAAENFNDPRPDNAKHLWGYTLREPAAQACLLAIGGKFSGHEVFYIVAPDTTHELASLELAARYHPAVPVRGDLTGHKSFFDSSKAERILGWRHG
jgi:nucleoside-diphosphate-sugar epimerase